MHRSLEYGFDDVSQESNFSEMKIKINGWVQVAIKSPNEQISALGFMIFPDAAYSGIMIFCDEEGLLKNLELTWRRPWDEAPLVGKLYWVAYREIMTDEGPDFTIHPLPEHQIRSIVADLTTLGWNELMLFDEEVALKDNLPGGGKMGTV